jgi:hypothetical protein
LISSFATSPYRTSPKIIRSGGHRRVVLTASVEIHGDFNPKVAFQPLKNSISCYPNPRM